MRIRKPRRLQIVSNCSIPFTSPHCMVPMPRCCNAYTKATRRPYVHGQRHMVGYHCIWHVIRMPLPVLFVFCWNIIPKRPRQVDVLFSFLIACTSSELEHVGTWSDIQASLLTIIPRLKYEITQVGGKICGSLPLHLATRNGCDSEILKMLFEAYPEALKKKNSLGDTPWQSLDVSSVV